MVKFSHDEIKQRAFERAAWVLKHFFDEQAEEFPGEARVHSRIFDMLIPDKHIFMGKSEAAAAAEEQGSLPYREHLVPCAYIRDLAFALFRDGRTENEVANMIERLLRIAFIAPEEAKLLNREYKSSMPPDWNWIRDAVTKRLDDAGIKLILQG